MKRLIFLFAFVLMGSSLPTLKYRAMDNSGVPMSGAKLYFYTHGTTTPKATYSDEALSTANANPVVADSHGWFGEIYLSTNDLYKVVLKSSVGITVWTLDNISPAQLASSSLQTRIGQIAANPLDYGAVGDGVADETAYVQAAINAATGTVDLLGKTYRCDTTITVPSNITLKNGTLDFSSSASTSYITLTGTLGTAVTLDANVAVGATTFSPTSSTSFSPGDWFLGRTLTSWAGAAQKYGEMFRVLSVPAGNLLVDRAARGPYDFATDPGIYEMIPVTAVSIEDISIVASTSASGTGRGISLKYATDIVIRDVRVTGIKEAAVGIEASSNVTIRGCTFTTGAASTSVGVKVFGISRDVRVENTTMSNLSKGVNLTVSGATVEGLIADTVVRGCSIHYCTTPITLGTSSVASRIENNIIYNADTTAVSATSSSFTLADNDIQSADDGYVTIVANTPSTNIDDAIIIRGNTIKTRSLSFATPTTPLTALDLFVISNNDIIPTSASDIAVSISATSSAITYPPITTEVLGNRIVGDFAYGVKTSHVHTQKISGNTINDTTVGATYGIWLHAPKTYALATQNNVRGVNQAGGASIFVETDAAYPPSLDLSGNNLNSDTTGIRLTESVAGTIANISDNTIYGIENGVRVASAAVSMGDLNITGNVITGIASTSCGTVCISGTGTKITIVGNQLSRTDDSAPNITLSCNSAGSITSPIITGNTITNGTYSITSDAYNGVFNTNHYIGAATGNISSSTVYSTEASPRILGTPTSRVIPADGTGAAATYTLTPAYSLEPVSCADTDGCTLSLSETGAVLGQEVTICPPGSTNAISLPESAGVVNLTGTGSVTLGNGDCIRLVYQSSEWRERGRFKANGLPLDGSVTAYTIADEGTGAKAIQAVASVVSAYYDVTCNDTDGCDVRLTGAAANVRQVITLCNISASNVVYVYDSGHTGGGSELYTMLAASAASTPGGSCKLFTYNNGHWGAF